MQNSSPIIKRALLSVSNKTGLIEFAKQLCAFNIEILSTGGTATLLKQHNIPVIDVSQYTGFPEIMDGRVKTLHPKIHGGLLARRGKDETVLAQFDIQLIELLVVNLYPFQETIAKPDCDVATAIENIDIGGPTLLRAAAKNFTAVTVIVDANDYSKVLSEMQTNHQTVSYDTRFYLAKKAFAHTAQYDAAITRYFESMAADTTGASIFPNTYNATFHKQVDLRYGENPHQKAALYLEADAPQATIASSQQLQGKELSFNNIADGDAALECVKNFTTPACVIVKHANPCGVALSTDLCQAYQRAYATDPTSAFGGIIAFNQTIDAKTATAIIAQQFAEVIIGPDLDPQAQAIFATKPNIRVLRCGTWQQSTHTMSFDYKKISGGLLLQEQDMISYQLELLKTVTTREPTAQELPDLLFAWQVAKYVKSNAIIYAKDNATVGIGAGQMSRVYSARIATIKAADADLNINGSVMASDAFFPFRDGIDTAAAAGVTAIIQPGGSVRDAEIIQAANEANIAMVFTGVRHFRH